MCDDVKPKSNPIQFPIPKCNHNKIKVQPKMQEIGCDCEGTYQSQSPITMLRCVGGPRDENCLLKTNLSTTFSNALFDFALIDFAVSGNFGNVRIDCGSLFPRSLLLFEALTMLWNLFGKFSRVYPDLNKQFRLGPSKENHK